MSEGHELKKKYREAINMREVNLKNNITVNKISNIFKKSR